MATMTAHNGPMPVPARITLALDHRGYWGAWVDKALGGEEPMVDEWEDGTRVPTRGQMEKLAELTKMPVEYFYRPFDEAEAAPARTFICDRSRRGENGLTIVESHVGWDGVLMVKELTPPRPPKRQR